MEVGKASGRFTFQDPLIALSAVGGALIALLQLNSARDLDAAAGEQMAEMILPMLGLPAGEAHEISTRPLPELP
ncbi:hypothetical protein [Streptomyces sp. NPDC006334]|uniref:hypothetical protein n=1 Tax=Streptomyces sp. NPDC006334 TaxID=3156754 RepID=UPI0033A0A0DA